MRLQGAIKLTPQVSTGENLKKILKDHKLFKEAEYTNPEEGGFGRALKKGLTGAAGVGLPLAAYGAFKGMARNRDPEMSTEEAALGGGLLFGGLGAIGGGLYGGYQGLQKESPEDYYARLYSDNKPEAIDLASQYLSKKNKVKSDLDHPHYKYVEHLFKKKAELDDYDHTIGLGLKGMLSGGIVGNAFHNPQKGNSRLSSILKGMGVGGLAGGGIGYGFDSYANNHQPSAPAPDNQTEKWHTAVEKNNAVMGRPVEHMDAYKPSKLTAEDAANMRSLNFEMAPPQTNSSMLLEERAKHFADLAKPGDKANVFKMYMDSHK